MAGNWIDGATAHAHGQFARKAAKAGMTTRAYAEKNKDAPGKLGEQARLALTLMGMHSKSHAETLYGKKD
jgi:hypothetical protein